MAAEIPNMFKKVNALGKLPGSLYRGEMPFVFAKANLEPKQKNFLQEMATKKIGIIVLLCPDEECLKLTSINLKAWYIDQKFRVIHLPIEDEGVPVFGELRQTVDNILIELKKGTNIAIHCQAGVGRTGLVLAVLAKKVLNIKGKAAIELIRKELPGAVETKGQMRLVDNF